MSVFVDGLATLQIRGSFRPFERSLYGCWWFEELDTKSINLSVFLELCQEQDNVESHAIEDHNTRMRSIEEEVGRIE
ncbi:hypothetical protein Fmac_028835 [Flemingia macrophylla]|uniref:Uncharacterized protein n=1 Tax=Flemingia macrophylla TaxID=520843 RepID=A0ABD1L8Q7_9FABA